MSSLEPDLTRIGDQLQARWRVDVRRARGRRRAGLVGAALAGVLALAGGAIAGGVLPIRLGPATSAPSTAALAELHALVDAPPSVPKGWKGAPALRMQQAVALGAITGAGTGRLSVFVVPVSPRGACVDAARPDGSSYLAACATFPQHATTVAGERLTYFQITSGYVGGTDGPPLALLLRSAPPGAVRVDVRTRSGARLPALLAHGWLVSLDQHPGGPVALVRFYDAAGTRILSFYG